MASNDISVSLKTNNLKDKDENLVLNFEGGSIISTGGNIKITQDGKTIEEIAIGGGKTSGGVYHSNSMVWDYEYNQIALVNDDIFKHLANHNNKKISDKTEEEWTTELRNDWKIAINGDLYSLAKRDQDLSSDDYYNYHETDPVYTPGVDKSGNGDVVLTPSSGIAQLTLNPSKSLQANASYEVDLSNAGFLSAASDSNDYLKFNEPLHFDVQDGRNAEDHEDDPPRKIAIRKDSNSYYAGELSVNTSQSINVRKGARFSIKEMNNGNFAIAKDRKHLRKLSRSNVDVVYDQTTGNLYLNDNLNGKGWASKGQGSLLAKFNSKPGLSNSNFDSLIDYSKDYDRSGKRASYANWFLNAYRNTPRNQLFSLFKYAKEIESRYDPPKNLSDQFFIAAQQLSLVDQDASKILWNNSPNQDPRLRNGLGRSDEYHAFINSFELRGDAEMLTQGKEEYIFF